MMRKLLLTIAVILAATSGAWAQTVEWQGVNTSVATDMEQIDVDDANLWFDGTATGVRSPTATDDVLFNYNAVNAFIRDDLAIPVGSSFEANSLAFTAMDWNGPLKMPLYLQKSLSLDNIYLSFGYSSGG